MKALLLVALLAVTGCSQNNPLAPSAQPQEFLTVIGSVFDAVTGTPVVLAPVTLVESGRVSQTTVLGWFGFNDLERGAITLRVLAPGYQPQEQRVIVPQTGAAVFHLTR